MSSSKSQVTTLEELLETNRTPGARQGGEGRIRKAIITGGDSGIGRYTALALAQDGCDVGITYAHHEEDAKLTAEAVRHYGRKCYIQKMDLETPENAVTAVDALVKQLGGLDIFFSNAGIMTMNTFPDLDLRDMDELFRINTFGAVIAIQAATKHMKGRETPGRIIVNTSVHEHIASPVDTVYTMTKHALGGFIKCAAFALMGTNITINGVRPGEITTPMNDAHPEDAIGSERETIPSRRAGHPTEIAAMVRYLASDDSSYSNGVSYDVGGGMSIGEPMAAGMYRKAVTSGV